MYLFRSRVLGLEIGEGVWAMARYLYTYTTLESSPWQILSQSPTDATSSRWHLYGS